MEASKTYDLLPDDKKNDIFRVAFDLFTARPHFMLLPKPGIEGMSTDHSLTPEEKENLIKAARDMLSSSNISCGTLSIHRGSWISKRGRAAHFHLCVDAKKYLEIFMAKKKTDYFSWFDDENYAQKCVFIYSVIYPKKIEEYPSPKYQGKEVNGIIDIIIQGTSNSSTKEQGTSENTEHLLYHRKHPKIGFPGNGIVGDLKDILIKMEEYAVRNNLTNPDSEDENDGCHLCLNLGSDAWYVPNWAETSSGVVGYIVVSGPRFYQLCPEELRESWFEAFMQSRFECET